jgi:DNA-3-methyladenine glycosylase I
MTTRDVARLMKDAGIIRHRGKITGTITNARNFLKIQKEYGTFAKYIWSFTNGKSIVGNPRNLKDYRSHSPESHAMSKDLKKRGFVFAGPVICYAFMQGIGMAQDHTVTCWKYKKRKAINAKRIAKDIKKK